MFAAMGSPGSVLGPPSAHRRCHANIGAAASLQAAPGRATVAAQRAAAACRPASFRECSLASPRRHLSLRRARQPAQAAASGSAVAAAAPANGSGSLRAALGRFLAANYMPVGLLLAVALGWFFPGPGLAAAGAELHLAATLGIFVVSGLLLQEGEMLSALRSTAALAYGLVAILAATPLLALGVLRLPLQPPEMALGLAVFCCMPTTLSACVALTTASNGNAAVALLLTVLTNSLGVFTIPAVLSMVLGSASGFAGFDTLLLFRNLVLTVLLPLAAGAAAQAIIPGAQHWKRDHRRLLSYTSTACLCTVPWMQVSKAASARLPVAPSSLGLAAAVALALHLLLLAANLAATARVPFSRDPKEQLAIRKAVVLASSQKTLPVAVAVLTQLSGVLGPAIGLVVIPCVMAHCLQTVFDSALVARWNAREAAGLPPLAG